MTPGWGRKRCSRRPFPPPLCVPMPRPCLDSLQIPTLLPFPLDQTLRTEFSPCCVQPSCGIKHRTCHCADKNYCTSETCTNSASCMQSQNCLSSGGFKGGKGEKSVCNGPCHQQEVRERNYAENYEIACNEASCEQLENCGVGAISNGEELIHPVTYTPSVTNQSSLSRTPTIVPSKQKSFNNDSAQNNNHIDDHLPIVGFTGRGINQKSINFDEVSKLSNINRSIQTNMDYEKVSERRRDEESSVAPEDCSNGNEVPNSLSLSGSSQDKLCNVNKINGPVQNIKSIFDSAIEKYDINVQPYCQKNENHAKINYINGTPVHSASQRSTGTNIDSLHIRDNTENILPEENILPNCIPSSIKTKPNINASTSNELAKIPLLSNNSTNERKLFNEGQNQFMRSASNKCGISGTSPGYLGSSESTSQKSPQIISPLPSTNIQHIKPYTEPLLTNNTSQVRFHDNNHINNAIYFSPIENQNLKINAPSRSSKMRINNSSSKEINCENYKQGCCTHDACETSKRRELSAYKPAPQLSCACPDELESWTEPKQEQKNVQKFDFCDLNDIRHEKKPACRFKDGTTSCASTTCVVNQNLGCSCRYPPAFKQFSCTGNISGTCNCNEKN